MKEGAEPERLQKRIAQMGLASRREAEEWIRAGRLSVNGAIATLGVRVGPRDRIELDGRPLRARVRAPRVAFIAHRSPGDDIQVRHEPPAERADEEHARDATAAEPRDAVVERIPRRAGRRFMTVSPMPRIDGGLELLTSDGELAAELQRAAQRWTAEFSVRVHGEIDDTHMARILAGELDRDTPLDVIRCEAGGGEGANRWYVIEARRASGKAVRQLFERQGALVSRILRTRLGALVLDRSLARGKLRRLTEGEVATLLGTPAPLPPSAQPQSRKAHARRKPDRRPASAKRARAVSPARRKSRP